MRSHASALLSTCTSRPPTQRERRASPHSAAPLAAAAAGHSRRLRRPTPVTRSGDSPAAQEATHSSHPAHSRSTARALSAQSPPANPTQPAAQRLRQLAARLREGVEVRLLSVRCLDYLRDCRGGASMCPCRRCPLGMSVVRGGAGGLAPGWRPLERYAQGRGRSRIPGRALAHPILTCSDSAGRALTSLAAAAAALIAASASEAPGRRGTCV